MLKIATPLIQTQRFAFGGIVISSPNFGINDEILSNIPVMGTITRFVLCLLTAAALSHFSPTRAVAQETIQPLIGINVDVSGDTRTGRFQLSSNYVDAITSAGGLPILLPPIEDPAAARYFAELCDGFVFSGGRDISPQRFGETEVHESVNLLNPRREEFDFTLMQAALDAGKPVLGICLGSQELNVLLGGTMIADLPTMTSSTIDHKPGNARPSHMVDITTGTMLHSIVTSTSLEVNSIHHQACDRMGQGILVSARAPDGVVEAFEVPDAKNFTMGIQWHPEYLIENPEHLAIYRALIIAAIETKMAASPPDIP